MPVPDRVYDPEERKARARAYLALHGVEQLRVERQAVERERRAQEAAARLEHLAAAAPSNIEAHAELLHRTAAGKPVRLPPHMQEWAKIAHAIDYFRWVVIVAPPGYAKTTFWTNIYPSWEIGRNPALRVGLISNTATQAWENSKALQESVSGRWYQEVYGPLVQPHYDWGWTDAAWYVQGNPGPPNPTCLASGIGGQGTLGKRFDLEVIDDPTTYEQARSKTIMQGQASWLTNTLLRRFPAGSGPPRTQGTSSRAVVVLTRWGQRDLVPTLMDQGFTVIRMPALGFHDRMARCDACGLERDPDLLAVLQRCEHCDSDVEPVIVYGQQALWPDVEDQAQLLAMRDQEPLTFDLVMQGDAKAGNIGGTFDGDNFQRGLPGLGNITKAVQYVDTAGGKDQQAGDYFVMMTMAYEGTPPDHKVWVLDIDRGRYTSPQQKQRVVANYTKWNALLPNVNIERVGIEDKNEGTSLFQLLVADGTGMPLVPDPPEGDKTFRAIPIANAYSQRMVWHNQAPWNREYEAELEFFPIGDHDDQVDAASGCYKMLGNRGPNLRVLATRGRR
jgi:predicted phage terminase large subunit-like protein